MERTLGDKLVSLLFEDDNVSSTESKIQLSMNDCLIAPLLSFGFSVLEYVADNCDEGNAWEASPRDL